MANLGISLNKTKVASEEPFILEIEATNPLNQTTQGGITVSADVSVIIKNPESKIYPAGSSIKHNNSIENLMVENWYSYWLPHTTKTMRLKLSTLGTGVLELYIRAAFLDNFGTVIKNPTNSNMYDQQKYPVLVKKIQVEKLYFGTNSLRPKIEYKPR